MYPARKEWNFQMKTMPIWSCPSIINKKSTQHIREIITYIYPNAQSCITSWSPGSDTHLKTLEIMKLIFFVSWRMILNRSKIFTHTQMLMRLALIRNDESFSPGQPIFSVTLSLLENYSNYAIMCQMGIYHE